MRLREIGVSLVLTGCLASTAVAGMAEYHFIDVGNRLELKATTPYPNPDINCGQNAAGTAQECTFEADVNGFKIPNKTLAAFLVEPGPGSQRGDLDPARLSDYIFYSKVGTEADGDESLFIQFVSDIDNVPLRFIFDGQDLTSLAEVALLVETGQKQLITAFHDLNNFRMPVVGPEPTDQFFITSDVPEPPVLPLVLAGFAGLVYASGRRLRRAPVAPH